MRSFLEEEIANCAAPASSILLEQQLAAVVDLLAGAKPSIISLLHDANGGGGTASEAGGEGPRDWAAEGAAGRGHAAGRELCARYGLASLACRPSECA